MVLDDARPELGDEKVEEEDDEDENEVIEIVPEEVFEQTIILDLVCDWDVIGGMTSFTCDIFTVPLSSLSSFFFLLAVISSYNARIHLHLTVSIRLVFYFIVLHRWQTEIESVESQTSHFCNVIVNEITL